MGHAMPFSARALKKTFSLTLILCGKKQIEMWFFVVCALIDNEYASLLFSQAFFELFLHIKRVCKSFEKSDAYKQLICMMQRVHFQVRVGVFSCQDKYLFRYLWYCGKKQIKCGLAWSVLLSTTIRVITVVKMLCASWVCNKLSYITKRALFFNFWVRQQHAPMGK